MVKQLLNYCVLSLFSALTACATMPVGPSIPVMPAPGKPFEVFIQEDAACRQWAERQIGISPQEVADKNTATGAITGTAIGAGVGALLGAASGHVGVGAAIGGASGLLIGTASGSNSGQFYGQEAQRHYDIAYLQCMYANGNQVARTRRGIRRTYRTYTVAPSPPPIVAPQYYESIPPPPPGAKPQTPPELIDNKGGMP